MELARHDVALLHRRDELPAVLARREHPVLVLLTRRRAVGVDKVQPISRRHVTHEPSVSFEVQSVPSDVRYHQAVADELADGPWDDAESFHAPGLFAAVEQELEAEADAHERLAAGDVVFDWIDEAARFEDVHRGAVRADAREDELVRGGDARGVVHGLDREPEGLDGVADAPDVAGAVVQEGHLAFGFSRGDEDGRAARYGRDAGDGAAAERARGALELRERGGGGDGCREHGGVA